MSSVKRFGYTVLLSILTASDCICFLWLLTLCGSTHEYLLKSTGAAPVGHYLALLAQTGDFWLALLSFLLNTFALVAVLLLLRRERRRRSAEVEQEELFENETEWEQQP